MLLVVAWTAWTAWHARHELTQARAEIASLDDRDGLSPARVDEVAQRVQQHLASADGDLGQPQWALIATLPVVGDDVGVLRDAVSAGSDLATAAVDRLSIARAALDRLQVRGGGLDLDALARLQDVLARIQPDVRAAADRLDALDTTGVSSRVAEPVESLRTRVDELQGSVDGGRTAVEVLADLLAGRRSYALVFQNSAELRSTGGLPGAWTQLRVDDGRVRVGRQGAGQDVVATAPVAPVDASFAQAFTDGVAQDFRNTNLVPDYPTAASLQRRLLARVARLDVDGVVAIDPVAVSLLMRATGPITVDGRRLDADTVVPFLLSEVYALYPDPDRQDEVFAEVVRVVFEKVTSGGLDPLQLMRQARQAIDQRRLLVWSADERTQRLIAPTPVSGALPRGQAVGVYLSDDTRAKMSYYLDVSTLARTDGCTAAGAQRYDVTLTLRSTAPADAATTLPAYVLGTPYGPKGSQAVQVVLVGPRGGRIDTPTLLGRPLPFRRARMLDRPALILGLPLDPGDALLVDATMTGPAGGRGPTDYAVTPTVRYASTLHTLPPAC